MATPEDVLDAGDDAITAGFHVMLGDEMAYDLDAWINYVLDLVAQRTDVVAPIDKGGTAATTAAGARTNLGLGSAATATASTAATEATVVMRGGGGRIAVGTPVDGNNAATKGYVDGAVGDRVSKSGDTMSGNLFLPASTAATSGYTVAYINVDGRVSRGASTARYKKTIKRAPVIPDPFVVPIASYVMKEDPENVTRYGPIAEDLASNPVTAGFVVYDAENRPESFDMISYLMAAVARLHARVAELEAGG